MKLQKTFFLFLVLVFVLSACASTDLGEPAVSQNGIEIYAPWVRAAGLNPGGDMHGGGAVTGAFMLIKNTNTQADMLLGASAEVADEVQIHQTTMSNGVMSMAEVYGVEIPANGQAELKPGGYHVMLIGLKQELKDGETISLRLNFQDAGEVIVQAAVRNP
jgi:periplasmic copper chaperone A